KLTPALCHGYVNRLHNVIIRPVGFFHVSLYRKRVLAEVCSWDLPPLPERYKKACKSLDV
ncbi:tonsoku-like protein, partial [Silurus asotus]